MPEKCWIKIKTRIGLAERRAFEKKIAASDKRIATAMKKLQSSERGQQVLRDLKQFLRGDACGLDSMGQGAVVNLVQEFCLGGRRNFLDTI